MAYVAEREDARTEFVPSLVQPVSPAKDAMTLRALRRIARGFRPDIVHTHTAKAGFLGRAAALTLRPRPAIVHTYHGHVLEGYFGPLTSSAYRRLERSLGARSDLLIGVSQATVDDLVRLEVAPRERFRVVPLGLDLAPFASIEDVDRAAARKELGIAHDAVLAVFVGRVVPIKRLDVLLRAVAQAIGAGAPLRLAIVGDGETRPGLERLAAELGIGPAVSFLGYRRGLRPIFAAADLAVLSSDNEGTPVSLIEAAAAGVPAVATAVGGVGEVVSAETGRLVAPADAQALAGALASMAADRELRRSMGARARELALQRYSVARLIGDLDQIYKALAERRVPDAA